MTFPPQKPGPDEVSMSDSHVTHRRRAAMIPVDSDLDLADELDVRLRVGADPSKAITGSRAQDVQERGEGEGKEKETASGALKRKASVDVEGLRKEEIEETEVDIGKMVEEKARKEDNEVGKAEGREQK
ncbi:hypothetical protein LTR66_017657 [Elasticomyces elasticus]|nr:hypothetical protein LTR66_017657 [Elasticomyces elasticus]